MTHIYEIIDEHGNLLAAGLRGHDRARQVAQRKADRLGETVYIYENGVDGCERVAPSPPPPRRYAGIL